MKVEAALIGLPPLSTMFLFASFLLVASSGKTMNMQRGLPPRCATFTWRGGTRAAAMHRKNYAAACGLPRCSAKSIAAGADAGRAAATRPACINNAYIKKLRLCILNLEKFKQK